MCWKGSAEVKHVSCPNTVIRLHCGALRLAKKPPRLRSQKPSGPNARKSALPPTDLLHQAILNPLPPQNSRGLLGVSWVVKSSYKYPE